MARTALQIIEDAGKRYSTARQATGLLTRADLIEFIESLPVDADKSTEIHNFLDQCTFLTVEDKMKVMNDLPSYGI